MLKIFERQINGLDGRLVVLAPPQASIPSALTNVTADSDEYEDLKRQVQRFRGEIYLRDGALRRDDLTWDGRHETPEDDRAWHVLLLDAERRLSGCIWYLEHSPSPRFEQLRARRCSLAGHDSWRDRLKDAVMSEVMRARRERIHYAEVGGWAVACDSQCITAALMLILGTYSLSQLAGGALVMATATVRHSSARILQRLGGSRFESEGVSIPQYYDPHYDCEMELLRFDTRRPATKYAGVVSMLKRRMADIHVIAPEPSEARVARATADLSMPTVFA